MSATLDQLLDRARFIGVHEVAYPMDVFSAATEIAEHPDAQERLSDIVDLVSDAENHFTRWAAIRAISQMGRSAVEKARGSLVRQLEVEDYELAAKELHDALVVGSDT